jgi:hypothetical protein
MKPLLFVAAVMAVLVLLTGAAAAQPKSMYLNNVSTTDSLDRSDTTLTKLYKPAGVQLRMVWVTIRSTVPDTLTIWASQRFPTVPGGLVPDTSEFRVLAYQPERTSSVDTTGQVIFLPIVGQAVYQARFRIYEPLVSWPFRFKTTYKKDGVWYIRIETKE